MSSLNKRKKMKKMQNQEERVIKNVNKGLLKPAGACISGKQLIETHS